MLETLLNKIKIIITGAKKRKNIKMIKIYSFQRKILVKSTQNDDMKKKLKTCNSSSCFLDIAGFI